MIQQRACNNAAIPAVLATLCLAGVAIAAEHDPLPDHFVSPARESGASLYMCWPNGSVTAEGLKREMAAYGKVPIVAVDLDDRASDESVRGSALCLSPEWDARMVDAAREAHANGIEAGLHLCPGFSIAGGPWVTPELAQRMVRTDEWVVEGGRRIQMKLETDPRFRAQSRDYRPIALLAIPVDEGARLSSIGANFAASTGEPGQLAAKTVIKLDGKQVAGWAGKTDQLAASKEKGAPWIALATDKPFTARTLVLDCVEDLDLEIQASDDGAQWRTVAKYDDRGRGKTFQSNFTLTPMRVSLPATTAKHFRILFHMGGKKPVAGLDLLEAPTIADYGGKGMFIHRYEFWPTQLDEAGQRFVIDPAKVLNLSGKVAADGTLDWEAPPGRWTLVRVGHVATEKTNHPAVEGKGLECDKLSAEAVTHHFNNYIGRIQENCRKAGSAPFNSIHLDSYESGSQNWTPKMIEEFKTRRGYDPTPWLLTLTGRIVGSPEHSDRFLAEFRRTVGDLALDDFIGLVTRLAHERGMTTNAQIYGNVFGEIWDTLQAAGRVDQVENEFWGNERRGSSGKFVTEARVTGIPDAAHVYGLKVCSAESWTGGIDYRLSPRDYATYGDLMWTRGVNRFSPHATSHQPWPDARPGFITNNTYGPAFHHTQAWWPLSKGWWDSVARAQHLLQQGTHRADILYLYGDDVPKRLNSRQPRLPAGYRMDACPVEIVIERLAVDPATGDLVLPQGQRYKMLLLPPDDTMRPAVALKIEEMVKAGATIAGAKPRGSNHLTADPDKADAEVRRVAEALWGKGNEAVRTVGKGRVATAWDLGAVRKEWEERTPQVQHGVNWFPVTGLEKALDALSLKPDVDGTEGDHDLAWIRRETDHDSIYMVSNQTGKPLKRTVTFRQDMRTPEIWNARDGPMERALIQRTADGRTAMDLTLEAGRSSFVVFRDKPAAPVLVRKPVGEPIPVTGPWTVTFEKNLGAPESITLDQLASLHTHSVPGVKYFSGIAKYRKNLSLPEVAVAGTEILLELGEVNDIARVSVNGKEVANLWCAPYRASIPAAAFKSGDNELVIEVAIPWANRLIGDEELPPDAPRTERKVLTETRERYAEIPEWVKTGGKSPNGRVTFVTAATKGAMKGNPLEPSGLIGPVNLQPLVAK